MCLGCIGVLGWYFNKDWHVGDWKQTWRGRDELLEDVSRMPVQSENDALNAMIPVFGRYVNRFLRLAEIHDGKAIATTDQQRITQLQAPF